MQDETLDVEVENRDPYPWARSLLVVVLYLSLLVFLWHFPGEGVRLFVRNLFKGFGYVLAGLALVVVTLLALTLIPLPFAVREEEDDDDEVEDWAPVTLPGRVLMIPDLKSSSRVSRILDVLYEFSREQDFPASLLVTDTTYGALTVAVDEDEDADWVLSEVKTRLREAGIRVHLPR